MKVAVNSERKILRGWPAFAALFVVGITSISCAERQPDWSQGSVPFERLVAARKDSSNWLMYSGAYDGQRHTLLSGINGENVARLRVRWSFPLKTTHPVETTPLVVDGVMYLTRPPNDVVALDAATGAELWTFHWPAPSEQLLCCGKINRGLAILDSTLFLATLDAHLVALDVRTGAKRWQVQVANWRDGYNITSAPLVVRDLVLTGTALDQVSIDPQVNGDVAAQRGRVDAYDASTGDLKWRFYTVPVNDERGSETWEGKSWTAGGNATWLTGSYDPEEDLVYWGTGAPTLTMFGNSRPGDNLFGSSLVALNARTGELVWHFQFTPHDTRDWDAAQIPVLAEVTINDSVRRVVMTANRNGFFYVLDRSKRSFRLAKPFAMQTWADRVDSVGRPVITRPIDPTEEGVEIAPTMDGATSWWSPSYSPVTELFYVTAHDASEVYFNPPIGAVVDRAERVRVGTAVAFHRRVDASKLVSAVRALDVRTGERRWEFRLPSRSTAGILTTATNLLFTGSALGDVWALDAQTGTILWSEKIEGWVHSAPIAYRANGEQFVVVASSSAIYAFTLSPAATRTIQ